METVLAWGKALELIEARLGQFQPGTRYLLGKPMNPACSGRLGDGIQCQVRLYVQSPHQGVPGNPGDTAMPMAAVSLFAPVMMG